MTSAGNGSIDLEIGEAAIAAVGALSSGQLLSAVTPERIGELTGYSASSIRYRLNGSASATQQQQQPQQARAGTRSRGWSFDREALLACAVDAYRLRAHTLREEARDRYLPALTALETGDTRPLELALEAEVEAATAGDAERLYLIALAGGDRSTAIAGLLRQVESDRREANRSLTLRGLALLSREPAPCITTDEVAEAVNHYLRGLAMRRGFEPDAGAGVVLRAVLGIVFGLTRPIDTPAPAVAAALASLGIGM